MILLDLLLSFLKIGFLSIGGGYAIIPLIQEEVVNARHWITEETFTDIITISQMTPGPLAVNTSTFVGIQIAGIPGAIAATLGCVFMGIVITLLLYRFFSRHGSSPGLTAMLNGLKSASLGLIVSAGATILMLTFWESSDIHRLGQTDFIAILIFIGSLALLRMKKTGPIPLMAITGFLGILFYL